MRALPDEERALPEHVLVDPTATEIWIEPWPDPVTDELGHDPKSPYVERFWLGILGPSATWLLRSVSYGFDVAPNGFALAPIETARVLGIGDRTGKHSPLQRALGRLCTFDLAYRRGDTLVVRARVPWLEPRQVQRLSANLVAEHRLWEDAELQNSAVHATRRRAATLALSTARTGGSSSDVVRVLSRSGVDRDATHELTTWALTQLGLSNRTPREAKAG